MLTSSRARVLVATAMLLTVTVSARLYAGTITPQIGGGIGQSRTLMLLLRKAHLGEVSVTVWPKALRDICEQKNIHVLQ